MLKNDMVSELAFYGKDFAKIGHLYLRPAKMEVKYPDLLFLSLFATRVMVHKKLQLANANEIQAHLKMGREWEKAINADETAAFKMPVQVVANKGYAKTSISSSLMLDKKPHFRFGYFGFGFFVTNQRKLSKCAEYSVYATIYTIYQLNKKSKKALELLWQLLEALGNLPFGKELNKDNYQQAGINVYERITGDRAPHA